VFLVGMAESGRVYDGVEGTHNDENQEDSTSNGERGSYSDQDRILRDLFLLAGIEHLMVRHFT